MYHLILYFPSELTVISADLGIFYFHASLPIYLAFLWSVDMSDIWWYNGSAMSVCSTSTFNFCQAGKTLNNIFWRTEKKKKRTLPFSTRKGSVLFLLIDGLIEADGFVNKL